MVQFTKIAQYSEIQKKIAQYGILKKLQNW